MILLRKLSPGLEEDGVWHSENKQEWKGWLHPPSPLQRICTWFVVQSCLTLCDPTDCSMPGFPVHHQLPELAQTHVHRVGDAIQLSHPVSPFSSRLESSPASGSFSNGSAEGWNSSTLATWFEEQTKVYHCKTLEQKNILNAPQFFSSITSCIFLLAFLLSLW